MYEEELTCEEVEIVVVDAAGARYRETIRRIMSDINKKHEDPSPCVFFSFSCSSFQSFYPSILACIVQHGTPSSSDHIEDEEELDIPMFRVAHVFAQRHCSKTLVTHPGKVDSPKVPYQVCHP